MRKLIFLFSAFIVLISGCDATPVAPAAPGGDFVTSTLPPTSAPAATATVPTTNPAPTVESVPGTTTSEVNVRAEPSTASKSLGTIPPFSAVQVVGRESFGYWFRVRFNDGFGWVRADYVQVSAEIPLVDADSAPGSGVRGAIMRGVNVRSGPGRDYESLGLLNQYDIVVITQKDPLGEWVQIVYAPAPGGTGWIHVEYVEMENADGLTVVYETPAAEAAEPVSTQFAVGMDGDTADAPLATFIISPSSARAIRFIGEVSAPGDAEDWLAFTSSQAKIVIQLLCRAGAAQVELIPTVGKPIACDNSQSIEVVPDGAYLVRITPVSSGNPAFSRYEIEIEIFE